MDPSQDSGKQRLVKESDPTFQLVQRGKKALLPLKQVSFTVNLCQGYADMVMHQKYENELDQPLEIQFMMPLADNFSCTKIVIDFVMPDGSTEQYETRVIEREAAQQKYEDKVAAGETAVIATLPPIKTSCR